MLHVYGVEGATPAGLEALEGFAGVLDDGGWSYLVFTREAGAALGRAGLVVRYEARLPYEQWLDGEAGEPFEAGGLLVVPAWCEPPSRPGGPVLRLEPSLAFGTGAHPTSRRCLEVLAAAVSSSGPPGTVLDLGCGTGLLSLAACRLGARRALGCDTSALAVAVARRNAAANGLGDRATFFRCGAAELVLPADLVLANLPPVATAEALDHPSLRSCRLAVVSGMLASQARALEERPPAGLALVEVFEDGVFRTAVLAPAPGDL